MKLRHALAVLLVLAPAGPAPADEPPAARAVLGPVAWQELRFEAHKWLLSAGTVTRVELVPAGSVELREAPGQTGTHPDGPHVALLATESRLPFGRTESTRTWFDPVTGAALQYEKLLAGRKPALRAGRYTTAGVHVWRADPAGESESRRPPEAWTRRRDSHVVPRPALPRGERLVDSYTLLYLVSAAGLEPGGEARFYNLSRDRLIELRLAARQPIERRVRYDESRGGVVRQRTGAVVVLPVEVSARPAGGGADGNDVDLAFMGLRGTLAIYLEAATGVPVAIVGRADGVGEVTVRLERVTLAADGAPR
jgi:hypothetical protein